MPYNEFFHFARNIADGQVFPKFKILDKKYEFNNKQVTLQNKTQNFSNIVSWLEKNKVNCVSKYNNLSTTEKNDFKNLFIKMIQQKYTQKAIEMWSKLF